MEKYQLKKQLQAYEQWKSDLIRTIREFQPWLTQQGMASKQAMQRIARCLEVLENDRLTVAFVAEFSRGKTELINSIFFADYGHRLLPSTPGRTTMCPTEIFYDHKADAAYVRLLPIETRLAGLTLSEHKKHPDHWVHYPLNLGSLEQMEKTMSQVADVTRVTVEEAAQLGLYDQDSVSPHSLPQTHIEIPRWRHALISFPHPLLKQGLSILDTPGLNALGCEPELTLSMLPSAQAVLFVLAADTGVTRTDLEMWQQHIKRFHSSRQRGLMVTLNKVDTLWDELQEEGDISDAVQSQCSATAEVLGVDEEAVFPVSAQKGLLAKIRDDEALLKNSGLLHLESYLSRDILDLKTEIIKDNVNSDICQLIENTRGVVAARLKAVQQQQEELATLSGKSKEVIIHMMLKSREEQAQYLSDIKSFKINRKRLSDQAQILCSLIDVEAVRQLMEKARDDMAGNWTTLGLNSNMHDLFKDMRKRMQGAVDQNEIIRKLVRQAYRRFQSEHGFAIIPPKMFSVIEYRVELECLHKEAEAFMRSPATLASEKRFVVKRFFSVIGEKAVNVFTRARKESDAWLEKALEPLIYQIRDHKDMMERRLKDLQKVSRSRETLESRLEELETECNKVSQQLTALRNMHNTLTSSRPLTSEERPRPRLVSRKVS